jgi:hypothetical protein
MFDLCANCHTDDRRPSLLFCETAIQHVSFAGLRRPVAAAIDVDADHRFGNSRSGDCGSQQRTPIEIPFRLRTQIKQLARQWKIVCNSDNLCDGEKQMVEALPKMVAQASSEELAGALQEHRKRSVNTVFPSQVNPVIFEEWELRGTRKS